MAISRRLSAYTDPIPAYVQHTLVYVGFTLDHAGRETAYVRRTPVYVHRELAYAQHIPVYKHCTRTTTLTGKRTFNVHWFFLNIYWIMLFARQCTVSVHWCMFNKSRRTVVIRSRQLLQPSVRSTYAGVRSAYTGSRSPRAGSR